MDYIKLSLLIQSAQPETASDILTAYLSDLGFESFEETPQGLNAYIQEDFFDLDKVKTLLSEWNEESGSVGFQVEHIAKQNWNKLWESNFEPVVISDQCLIRATFHEDMPELPYRIVIQPQMSFGTGHHETTSLMVESMLDIDFHHKSVLDMGCGTGILALFAVMRQAASVTAIDNDDWACVNTRENCARNDIQSIEVACGDKQLLAGKSFDIILANINRNILLEDIPTYAASLPLDGLLLLSGFYTQDLEDIKDCAHRQGLHYLKHRTKNNWVGALFQKK